MHELKKFIFSANQKLFFCSKLYEFHSKPLFYAQKLLLHKPLRTVLKSRLFTYKKPFFCTNPSLLLSKTFLCHPPPPIRTTLNLLFAKNTAILLISALILCCKARISHRFKSLPAISGEVAVFRKTGYLMIAGHFRKNTLSTGDLNRPRSPEVRKPLVYFWFFSYTRKE